MELFKFQDKDDKDSIFSHSQTDRESVVSCCMFFSCRVQKGILKRGLELLAIKGQLLYSTTSLNPIENEAVIAGVLKDAKGKIQ